MKTLRKNLMLLTFVMPALIFYLVFVLVSASGGFFYSLTNWNGLNPAYNMVGLANYREALSDDPVFIRSLLFTLKYVIVMVVLQNGIALTLALLVEGRKKDKPFFRTLFFMPNMISLIIGGYMWMFIFTKVLPFIAELTFLNFLDQSWIGDPAFSFYAIVILSLWGGVGYLMIIYIAAIQGIPAALIESASIDGARPFQVFRHVSLPLIMPAVTIGIFLTLNTSFKVFDAVFALTGGGPGRATQVVALNIFEEAFNMNNRYGYASAKAMILFFIVFLITMVQLRFMKKRELEA